MWKICLQGHILSTAGDALSLLHLQIFCWLSPAFMVAYMHRKKSWQSLVLWLAKWCFQAMVLRNISDWSSDSIHLLWLLWQLQVGLVVLIALTGFIIFSLFLLIATANAVVVGLLMSASAVGAFTACFFTALTLIYVGVLTAAAFAIGTATVVCAGAVLFVTGLNCWSLSCKDFDYHSFFLSMLASGKHPGRNE